MSRHALLNLALVVALAAILGLHLALAPRPTDRNLEFLPEMVDSVPADSYAASPVFADGKTLQAPPPGTIPRGLPPLHFGRGPQEPARAGRELANPMALPAIYAEGAELPGPLASARAEERAAFERALAGGERIYAVYCALCHGPAGAGDGPVARRGFPAPPSLLAQKARAMADGQMFHLVTYGGENMPAYVAQVRRRERWQAILYVRELQRKGPVLDDPAEDAAPTPQGVGEELASARSTLVVPTHGGTWVGAGDSHSQALRQAQGDKRENDPNPRRPEETSSSAGQDSPERLP